MQNSSAGGSSPRRAPGPFVSGRAIVPAPPVPSSRPRPFAPAAVRTGRREAEPTAALPADESAAAEPLVMQAPVVVRDEEPSAPGFEGDVRTESAAAPEPDVAEPVQAEPAAQEAAPGHTELESDAPGAVAPEAVAPEAVDLPPAPPEPVNAVSHWAVATFSPGMADEEPVDPGVPHSRYEDVSMIDASTWSAEPDGAVVGHELRAAAEVLESVAGRLRRGEIVLAAGSSIDSDAAVVAAVLSALLGAHR